MAAPNSVIRMHALYLSSAADMLASAHRVFITVIAQCLQNSFLAYARVSGFFLLWQFLFADVRGSRASAQVTVVCRKHANLVYTNVQMQTTYT